MFQQGCICCWKWLLYINHVIRWWLGGGSGGEGYVIMGKGWVGQCFVAQPLITRISHTQPSLKDSQQNWGFSTIQLTREREREGISPRENEIGRKKEREEEKKFLPYQRSFTILWHLLSLRISLINPCFSLSLSLGTRAKHPLIQCAR